MGMSLKLEFSNRSTPLTKLVIEAIKSMVDMKEGSELELGVPKEVSVTIPNTLPAQTILVHVMYDNMFNQDGPGRDFEGGVLDELSVSINYDKSSKFTKYMGDGYEFEILRAIKEAFNFLFHYFTENEATSHIYAVSLNCHTTLYTGDMVDYFSVRADDIREYDRVEKDY